MLPVERLGSVLALVMADPSDREVIDAVRFATCVDVEPIAASQRAIDAAIARYHPEAAR